MCEGMYMSQIEQIISELEEYIENCSYKKLSSTKIVVNKEELKEYLDELRLKTPDEIKKYQKMLNNKDAILNDAHKKAAILLEEATAQTKALVSEHEVMQQANLRATEEITRAHDEARDILDIATNEANGLRSGMVAYADDMLYSMESILVDTINKVNQQYEAFVNSLNSSLEVIRNNHEELRFENKDLFGIESDSNVDSDLNEDLEDYRVEFDENL